MKNINDLLKSVPLDESVKDNLVKIWNKNLESAKVIAENKARKEIVDKYDSDLKTISESVNKFVKARVEKNIGNLSSDLVDIRESRDSLRDAKYNMIKENRNSMKKYKKALSKLVMEKVTTHIKEISEDVKANRMAAITSINESKSHYMQAQSNFKTKATKVIQYVIETKVANAVNEMKEDIMAAKKDQFGRELFESFYNTFKQQFFDSSKEYQMLRKENQHLKESAKRVVNKANIAIRESKEREAVNNKKASLIVERAKRKETISSMLAPLPSDLRSAAKKILENTKTEKLDTTFTQILNENVVGNKRPSKRVVNKNNKRKQSSKPQLISESSNFKQSNQKVSEEDNVLIEDIRRRSGIS